MGPRGSLSENQDTRAEGGGTVVNQCKGWNLLLQSGMDAAMSLGKDLKTDAISKSSSSYVAPSKLVTEVVARYLLWVMLLLRRQCGYWLQRAHGLVQRLRV